MRVGLTSHMTPWSATNHTTALHKELKLCPNIMGKELQEVHTLCTSQVALKLD